MPTIWPAYRREIGGLRVTRSPALGGGVISLSVWPTFVGLFFSLCCTPSARPGVPPLLLCRQENSPMQLIHKQSRCMALSGGVLDKHHVAGSENAPLTVACGDL